MGLLAAEWVVEAIKAREHRRKPPPRLHRAPPELVARMSSARLPARKKRTKGLLEGIG
jgi:hypothetical protein